MVGEIHLAQINFTDTSSSKVRPILLLKANSFKDLIFLPLTSNTATNGIKIDSNDLQDGFLPKTSIIVFEKPGVIATNLLLKKIGTLHLSVHNTVVAELVTFLQT